MLRIIKDPNPASPDTFYLIKDGQTVIGSYESETGEAHIEYSHSPNYRRQDLYTVIKAKFGFEPNELTFHGKGWVDKGTLTQSGRQWFDGPQPKFPGS